MSKSASRRSVTIRCAALAAFAGAALAIVFVIAASKGPAEPNAGARDTCDFTREAPSSAAGIAADEKAGACSEGDGSHAPD